MNKINYKSAMNHVKTSENFNEQTLNFLSDKVINKDKAVSKIKFSNQKYIYAAITTCFLMLAILIPMLNNSAIDLQYSTGNVSVKYVKHFTKVQSSSSLIWLSEEEIFNEYNTFIFQGEVVDIKNIKIEMGKNNENYRAIARIKITENYRGNESVGDIVEVLLPCPIGTDERVEDTDVISAIRVGTVGIFMPLKYDDENSIWIENGATLYKTDICEYGFLDGERYAFLQTENGLSYAEWAFESIPENPTLKDIKAYTLKMINNAK